MDAGKIARIKARDERVAQKLAGVGTGRVGKSGRQTLRVSQEAFFNAVDLNGGVDGKGQTVWDDPGYVADMKRMYPHIAVGSGRIFVGGRGDGAGVPRNRFGKVKCRVRFVDGQRCEERF